MNPIYPSLTVLVDPTLLKQALSQIVSTNPHELYTIYHQHANLEETLINFINNQDLEISNLSVQILSTLVDNAYRQSGLCDDMIEHIGKLKYELNTLLKTKASVAGQSILDKISHMQGG
jgi:hypothetical protein